MPQWPAQVNGQCIFCAFRHVFTQPNSVRPAAHLHLSSSSQRYSTVRQTWPGQTKAKDDEKGDPSLCERGDDGRWFKHEKKITFRGEERGNGHHFDGPEKGVILGEKRNNGKGFIGKKTLDIQKFASQKRFKLDKGGNFNATPSMLEIGAAISKQLENLKHQIAAKKASVEDGDSSIAKLDPDNEHWKSFEADMQRLITEATKTRRSETLSTKRWQLWLELKRAQMPRRDSSLEPRADVTRLLEFAYFDHLLQADKKSKSESPLFDPVAAYTDLRYPTEWYSAARSTQRQIHLHVGPTNSGKTYTALKRLEEAGDGYYCGPLRLLAHEVYARFQAKGLPCHLITGDDVRADASENVKLRSSTVEMVDTNMRVEVAVIDEIQMMAHEDRGWAWTRAFLGSNAKEVHLCGETRVTPLVRELAASMGDTLHIHNYERLSPLKVMSRSLKGNLKLLRKGDCIVSFSIIGIHALKKEIEKKTGRRVAIVYGSLPPETRAAQAELFNDPNNDYDFLVASDAIGMGLNLAVKRMIFESVYKHNGRMREVLSIPQIKQIAGRAGRYRTVRQAADNDANKDGEASSAPQTVGLVTCMEEVDLPIIQEALSTEPEPIKAAGLLPPAEFVEEYAARLPKGLPFQYIFQRVCDVAKMHPRFKLSEVENQTAIAKIIDSVPNLTIQDRLCFSSSPANTRKAQDVQLLTAFGNCVANGKPVACVDMPEIQLEILDEPMSGAREYLEGLELLHRSLILYLWLSYRFLGIFKDREQATYAKSMTEQRINDTLTKFSHSAELKERMRLLKKRQIKDSKMMSELDAEAGAKDRMSPVLSTEEPSTEDLPMALEPSSLEGSNPSKEDLATEPSSLEAIRLGSEDTPMESFSLLASSPSIENLAAEPSSLGLRSIDNASAAETPEARGVA